MTTQTDADTPTMAPDDMGFIALPWEPSTLRWGVHVLVRGMACGEGATSWSLVTTPAAALAFADLLEDGARRAPLVFRLRSFVDITADIEGFAFRAARGGLPEPSQDEAAHVLERAQESVRLGYERAATALVMPTLGRNGDTGAVMAVLLEGGYGAGITAFGLYPTDTALTYDPGSVRFATIVATTVDDYCRNPGSRHVLNPDTDRAAAAIRNAAHLAIRQSEIAHDPASWAGFGVSTAAGFVESVPPPAPHLSDERPPIAIFRGPDHLLLSTDPAV